MWKNLNFKGVEKLLPYEFSLTKMIIVVILGVVVLIITLNLLPFLKKAAKLKPAAWIYFFLIGMAFMIVEVVLIQKYTLFVGLSVYSISIILLTLLVMSGMGSRFPGRFSDYVPFIGIVLWLVLDVLLFTKITNQLGGLEPIPRILITAILLAPLGFFMGMPFPKAVKHVGELVDWGFAVNGAVSVFSYAYSAGLMFGGFVYLLSTGLLNCKRGW